MPAKTKKRVSDAPSSMIALAPRAARNSPSSGTAATSRLRPTAPVAPMNAPPTPKPSVTRRIPRTSRMPAWAISTLPIQPNRASP